MLYVYKFSLILTLEACFTALRLISLILSFVFFRFFHLFLVLLFLIVYLLCFRVFNKVKSRSAHMKSHRPLDAEPKRPKLEKPYEKVERSDDRSHATPEYQSKTPAQ